MSWTCQSGHVNDDPAPGTEGQIPCAQSGCSGYMVEEDEDDDEPSTADAEEVECDPDQAEGEECPGPHVEEEGYRIDETAGTTKNTTSAGVVRQFPTPTANTNSTDRPQMPRFIIRSAGDLVDFPGAGGTGKVHQVIVDPLTRMIDAMKAEGERINDRSLKEVVVASPWRNPATEGAAYLRNIRSQISAHSGCHSSGGGCSAGGVYSAERNHCPAGFQSVSFPSALEAEARSELGARGSTAWNTFRSNLRSASGWTRAHADYVLRQTGRFKAPAGGSPHHSGLVVDINWPVWSGGQVRLHGMSRSRNTAGRRSSAGVWINQHAATFGFKSYNEGDEIWHMEYVLWAGTTAEPSG